LGPLALFIVPSCCLLPPRRGSFHPSWLAGIPRASSLELGLQSVCCSRPTLRSLKTSHLGEIKGKHMPGTHARKDSQTLTLHILSSDSTHLYPVTPFLYSFFLVHNFPTLSFLFVLPPSYLVCLKFTQRFPGFKFGFTELWWWLGLTWVLPSKQDPPRNPTAPEQWSTV
jgi:hypothetical protein